jgi:PAS domain S-box-containing protein
MPGVTRGFMIKACLTLTRAMGRSRSAAEIYDAALDALESGLDVRRASVLLFDPDGVMRFKAFRGISDTYRAAVEGHTPWRPDSADAEAIWVPDVSADATLAVHASTFAREGIVGMAFIPLISLERVIGKFMLYFAAPTPRNEAAVQLACIIAAQVAFALDKMRSEDQARRSEARLRFALDAASMGTWDWDLKTNRVEWSDNLVRIHGLPDGSFDGTFDSYAREIHPDDRERVRASVQRALTEGAPHEVEYRIVAPDGVVRWCEGKGRVEYEDGRPVRMSGVCMMVTRRKEAELDRLAAAEETSRLKDEFLATLSHELRTPLNAILGWIQMVELGKLTPARTRQAIEVIGRNARLQARLIEDILDVSRIISGKLEIERETVSAHQFVDSVMAGIAPAADARGVLLEQRLSARLPAIQGDARRLHQVLNNVLANAVKFTPEGGTIVLRGDVVDRWVTLEVSDTGVGIAPDLLPFIFDRFRQGDSRSTRSYSGLGLGLAIARHLIELHGGEIAARSDGPGTGTTVTIRLPVGPEVVPRVETGARGGEGRLDGIDLLVVDDQQDSREMLVALLEGQGAAVVQGLSAESALELLGSRRVHLIIADIAMPRVDGYEFIRRLRAQGNQTPAIAVTAFARPDDRRRALLAGYSGYLAKPIDM